MTPELREACAKAVHVVTADGRVLRAGRAATYLLRYCGWWPVARIFSVPPFSWGAELGYRLVAGNRSVFAKIMFRKEPTGPADDPTAC